MTSTTARRLGVFPEHEIERIVLGLIDIDALAGAQVVERLAGSLPYPANLRTEKFTSPSGFVGQTVLFQFVDQVQHLRNVPVARGSWSVARRRARRSLRSKPMNGWSVHRWFRRFPGAPDDLVVDIGDVVHVGEIKAAGAQPALDHVEDDQNAGVARWQ